MAEVTVFHLCVLAHVLPAVVNASLTLFYLLSPSRTLTARTSSGSGVSSKSPQTPSLGLLWSISMCVPRPSPNCESLAGGVPLHVLCVQLRSRHRANVRLCSLIWAEPRLKPHAWEFQSWVGLCLPALGATPDRPRGACGWVPGVCWQGKRSPGISLTCCPAERGRLLHQVQCIKEIHGEGRGE